MLSTPINEGYQQGLSGDRAHSQGFCFMCVVFEMIHLAKDGHINISTAGKQICSFCWQLLSPLSIHRKQTILLSLPIQSKRSVSAGHQDTGGKSSRKQILAQECVMQQMRSPETHPGTTGQIAEEAAESTEAKQTPFLHLPGSQQITGLPWMLSAPAKTSYCLPPGG